jgi:hypothetical protein
VFKLFYLKRFLTEGIHPYFDGVVGLVWSNDLESYDGGSVATGRVSLAGQVKGDDPDPQIPWSSRLGVGREADLIP